MITSFRSTIWGRLKDLANAKVVQLANAGVPSAATGKYIAGRGSLYTDITAGDIYINKGTILVPSWTKANALALNSVQTDAKTLAVTGTTDFFIFTPADGKLERAVYVGNNNLPASITNYAVLSITNLGQDGTGNKQMLAVAEPNSTKTIALVAGTPRVLQLSNTESDLMVTKDDRIRVRAAIVGTLPNTITNAQFALDIRG